MKLFFPISFFVICLFLSEKCISQAGTLDKNFGTKGITIADFYESNNIGCAVAIQPDKKILLSGGSTSSSNKNHVLVYRYDKDGFLDTSFGNKGQVSLNLNYYTVIRSIALQPDKKIVLGGSNKGVLLKRLNPDGSMDSSFGLNGTVQYDTVKYDALISIKIQKDGKIVTAGQGNSPLYPGWNLFTLHRFNTDGSIDSTFGTNGDIYINLGDYRSTANDLVIQNDGKIVAGGFINIQVENFIYTPYVALIRFNIDGSVDNSFGHNGVDTVFINSPYDYGVSLALQQDQKILVSNFSGDNSNNTFALLRFRKNGGLDSSFANNGLALTSLSGNDNAYSVCVDSSGNIYQAGSAGADFGFVKYKSSGILDSSFGNNGVVVTSISNGDDFASSVEIQSGSKILVGGATQTDSGSHFFIARYNNEVVLPVSLLNFIAQKQNNKAFLHWQTSNEINNNYFNIERSADSKAFSAIGEVDGLNGTNTNNYSFTDNTPLQGTNYYRLKQVDNDGKFVYSNVVSVQFLNKPNNFSAALFPNPVKNNLILNFSSEKPIELQMQIVNTEGKVILYKKIKIAEGESKQTINIASYNAGNYFIKLSSSEGEIGLKFVKQ